MCRVTGLNIFFYAFTTVVIMANSPGEDSIDLGSSRRISFVQCPLANEEPGGHSTYLPPNETTYVDQQHYLETNVKRLS